mgnify:CR=1 FL=1
MSTYSSLDASYPLENCVFRTFCKTQFPDDFIDIETLNKIDEFQGKIEELKKVKEDLINIDKSNNFKSIEDPLNPN